MSKSIEWNRVTEVQARGGQSAGLQYSFPCGHTHFRSLEEIHAYVSAPEELSYSLNAPATCPEGCVIKEESEDDLKAALNAGGEEAQP